MKPLSFPEQTVVWAEDQPPYQPLPAYSNERETISLWGLTWRERLRVLFTGRLWLRQCNLGQPLQAQAPTTISPFIAPPARALRTVGITTALLWLCFASLPAQQADTAVLVLKRPKAAACIARRDGALEKVRTWGPAVLSLATLIVVVWRTRAREDIDAERPVILPLDPPRKPHGDDND